jgi:hypothetical protein
VARADSQDLMDPVRRCLEQVTEILTGQPWVQPWGDREQLIGQVFAGLA